jgi:Trp operon repressor
MDGVLHILNRLGQSIALLERRVAELETENAQLRQALQEQGDSTQGAP